MRRLSVVLMKEAVACALVIAGATACIDHEAAAPHGIGRAQLSLSVTSAAVESRVERGVDVSVSYLRAGGAEHVSLFVQRFTLDAGTKQLPVSVDLASCLADPDRGSSNGCSLIVDVVLRELGGPPLDSQSVGPFDAVPGQIVSFPPLTLREAATLTIVTGDQQVGWIGQPILQPVEVRVLDRAGAPVPGRAITVVAMSGGGTANGTSVTDANGIARTSYRLGPAPGPNEFAVSAVGVASRAVTATGVNVPRHTLSAGSLATCVIRPNGTPFCWGDNSSGMLGNPAVVTDTTLPVPMVGAVGFHTLELNSNGLNVSPACALTAAGRAYCWGSNPQGLLGVTSNDTCAGAFRTATSAHACATTPQPLPGDFVFRTVSTMGQFGTGLAGRTCGLTPDGTALCWGEGNDGALGNGGTSSTAIPSPVSGGLRFVALSTGGEFTCGVASTADVYCWGRNSEGTLGTGTTTSSTVPVKIASAERFQFVETGIRGVCALTIDGRAFCWGQQWNGTALAAQLTPLAAPGPVRFETLTVGGRHVCGIDAAGDAYCWGGDAGLGMLGDGVRHFAAPQGSTTPTRVAGNLKFREVSAGNAQTCGLTTIGDVYCWGLSARGELGNGARGSVLNVPARVNFDGALPGVPARLTPMDATTAPSQSTGSTAAIQPVVRVTDANGLALTGVAVTFAVTTGGGVLETPAPAPTASVVSGVDGIAALPGNWILGPNPGAQTVTASVSTQGVNPVSFTITAERPGIATTFESLPASFQVSTTSIGIGTFGIARDAKGLPVSGVPVAFSNTSGIRLLGQRQATDRDGRAAVSVIPGTVPRVDTITMAAAGLPLVTVEVRTVALTFSAVRFITQPPNASPGTVLAPPVRVEMLDPFGNRVEVAGTARDVTLSLAGGTTGAKLGGTTTATTVNGIATFADLTVDLAGIGFQLRAAAAGSSGPVTGLSAPFTIQAAGIRSITITPPLAVLRTGDLLDAVPNVDADPGISRAVTWSSSNTGVATVDANGRISALAPGVANITARSVVNPSITGTLSLTVRAPVAASASIMAVLMTGTSTAVNVGNASGSIDVVVRLDSGDETVTRVAALVDDVEFGSAPGGATFTLNTAAIVPATGKLRYCNGTRMLSLLVYVTGGPAGGRPSNRLPITFNNNGSC